MTRAHEHVDERPPAVIVGVQLPGVDDDDFRSSLDELARLAHTLGLDVVGRVVQRRPYLAKGTVLGEGKLRELAAWTGGKGEVPPPVKRKKTKAGVHARGDDTTAGASGEPGEFASEVADDAGPEAGHDAAGDERDGEGAAGEPAEPEPMASAARGLAAESGPPPGAPKATVVLVDHDLTPSQARNLEKATDAEVLDRTSVILKIFQRHARTREARLQVEIARLVYEAPRLRESGGGDRVRGGVGGKGAGESALELDRRKIRDRIAELRAELADIERDAGTRRKRRAAQPTVALVGYTNAGKSSLFRALTGSDVYVADKLFATLDTTVRALSPETRPRVLVSDTVGFIKNLPHDLVASFRSTLDEAREAHLLLHVVDAADPAWRAQRDVTLSVLRELGALEDADVLLVMNKVDLLEPTTRAVLSRELPDALFMSAREPADVARLRERIVAFFERDMREAELFVPYAESRRVAEAHREARVLAERHDEHGTHLRVRAPADVLARLGAPLADGAPRG